MQQIKEHIKLLYPTCYVDTLEGINLLVDTYKRVILPKNFELTSNDVVLIAYADSFKDGKEHGLKTLNKICKQYLSDTINSIHILPFYPFTSDDGFSVVDYKKVNTEFGNWDDIEELNHSFSLMFDAVINHISKSSDWFQGFLKEKPAYHDFFIEENPANTELKKVTRPRTWPLLHKYNKNGKDAYIWTTFSEDQVDLNYANPVVFLMVLEVLLFYISKGAKLIRLDAIAFMWKKIGTSCIHLKETHRIIQAYRAIIELVAPQTILITETNVPHNENISYFGNGLNEAHMVYNFSLPPLLAYSLHNQNIDILTQWAQSLKLPSDKTCFFNFTASHDGVGVRPLQNIVTDDEINKLAKIAECHGGFVSYKSNADGSNSAYEINCNYMDLLTNPKENNELRAKRFMLTQAVMVGMPGVPGVYYHSIFGSENDIDGAINSGINRRINREKIKVDELEQELSNDKSLRAIVFAQYKNLLSVRKQEKAFSPRAEARFLRENGVFIIERTYENEKIFCLHNFTTEPKNIEAYSQHSLNLTNNNSNTLEPFGFMWLKEE